jgi:hypothetical protein
MAYFNVVTNFRTFLIEAAGIGDAIDRTLNLILVNGEYMRDITPAAAPGVAA